MKTDKALWTQLFQDKPIPSNVLEHFQTQLMSQIMAHPVDFSEEIRLAKRRKWGIGLVLSLMVAGLSFGAFLWVERNIVFQWANVLLVMLSGFTFISDLQQVGTRIVEGALLLSELQTGLNLLWSVVSWPIFGVLSVFVIFRSNDQTHHENPLSKKLELD
ncbi:MAG TPA: hypothetical protein VFC84_11250 [Desulfosporosinus sp.]|nr:hypothetical protein [Desulfosporosinus sp.]